MSSAPDSYSAAGSQPAGSRSRTRRWLVAGLVVAATLGVTGAAAGYKAASDVPRGVSVLGIELGGKSRAEAVDALRAGLADRGDQMATPMTVKIGDLRTTVQPEDVGLSVDLDATVDAATKDMTNPIAAIFGPARTLDPVVTIDTDRLAAALRPTAAKVGSAMSMPGVRFAGTTPTPIYPKPGQALDAAGAAQAVRAAWLHSTEATAPLSDVDPASSAADVDKIIADLARPAVAAPVTVETGNGRLTATPKVIAASLIIGADDRGRLTTHVDAKKLRAAWGSQLSRVETQPKNASLSTGKGAPKVLASSGGTTLDTTALAKDLLPVLSRTADRTVQGRVKRIEPATTSGELTRLGIREQISSFTTYFTGGLSSPRSKNIVQIAKEVDGAVVKPGETFSLNRHTGPRGYAEGYFDAPVIMNGKLTPGVGGGASQFTTTLFNASYYAGMQDVEHKPHSYYFTRYPAVIESTIFYPTLDLRFRNTTDHGVLIDTSYTNDSITVSMWSTKVWDSVKTAYAPKRDVTKPETKKLKGGPTCIATQGSEGFTQDAWRIFRKDGKEMKREKFTWRYDAEPRFVCEGDKSPR